MRFQYEWHDDAGQWHRSYGNEQWGFDEHGLMRRREASINDIVIKEGERRFHWPAPGPRPADVAGLSRSSVLMPAGGKGKGVVEAQRNFAGVGRGVPRPRL